MPKLNFWGGVGFSCYAWPKFQKTKWKYDGISVYLFQSISESSFLVRTSFGKFLGVFNMKQRCAE